MERINSLAAGIVIGNSCPSMTPDTKSLSDGKKRKSDTKQTEHESQMKSPRLQASQTQSDDNLVHPELNPSVLQQLPLQVKKLMIKEAANPLGVLGNALSKFSLKPEFTFADRSQIIQDNNSASNAKAKKKAIMVNHKWESVLHIGCVYIAHAESTNKLEAKRLCGEKAVSLLKNDHLIVRDVARNIHGQRVMRQELIALTKKGSNSDDGDKVNEEKNPLSRLVIMENAKETSPICTIMNSCQISKLAVSFEFKDLTESLGGQRAFVSKHICKVIVEGQVVGVGVDAIKKDAKKTAAEKALTRLRKICPTVKVNQEIEDALTKQEVMKTTIQENKELPDSNIGSKLMKKMGWSGGGLGKDGNKGIEVPIAIEERHRREGLGMGRPVGTDKIDYKTAQEIIKNYALSDNQDDLVFSSELNNDERKVIHQAAGKFGLKSRSYGSGDNRYLVIKKIRNAKDIVEHLTQSGGSSARYELILPEQH
ncbi:NF-kappa-B-repressing factor-like isoform X2 [Ptychodera flava]